MAEERRAPGTPLWVKIFGVIGIAVILIVVIILATGRGGEHGPGRHSQSGEPVEASEADRTIEIKTLDSMTFEPSSTNVSAGETITFMVTNAGQIVHEFTLGDAAMQQEHADMMAHMPAGMVHDTPNSITLQPGEAKQLTWRFGDAGTVEYACHLPGHYEAGMRGQVTIS